MSNSLNFPIKYEYTYVTSGDYVTNPANSCKYMYAYATNSIIKVLFDTSKTTDMSSMFEYCSNTSYISHFDTSNVTDMSYMFSNCSNLTSIPQLDTSKVTSMNNMFYNCNKLASIPLLDTSDVNSMSNFFGYSTVNALTDLGGFRDLGKRHSVSGTSSRFLDSAPNLTHESLMNVINNLYDRKSNGLSTLTISFGTTNLNKLTDEEKSIAVNKGWTLS